MLLKACLNGARKPAEHPGLPITAEQLADDAAAAFRRGVRAVHVHPKDSDGLDSLVPAIVHRALTLIRAAVPELPIGVSTGDWIGSTAERIAAILAWQTLPDFASVNWHEPEAAELAEALLAKGVAVEVGLFHAAAAQAWLRWEQRESSTLRLLIELPDGLEPREVPAAAAEILAVIASSRAEIPVLLHGEGSSCWPAAAYALRHGFDLRIGLEDTLTLPDGTVAKNNASLLDAVNELMNR